MNHKKIILACCFKEFNPLLPGHKTRLNIMVKSSWCSKTASFTEAGKLENRESNKKRALEKRILSKHTFFQEPTPTNFFPVMMPAMDKIVSIIHLREQFRSK